MRRTATSSWAMAASTALALTVAGCSSPSKSATGASSAPGAPRPDAANSAAGPATMPASAAAHRKERAKDRTKPGQTPTGDQTIAAAAEEQASRLQRAMAAPPGTGAGAESTSGDNPADSIPDVRWIDLKAEARRGARPAGAGSTPGTIEAESSASANAPASATQPSSRRTAAAGHARPGTPGFPGQPGQPVQASVQTRRELVAHLLDQIRAGQDPAMAKALAAAALSLSDPGRSLDAADLAGLTEVQRQQVRRFYDLVNSLARQLGTDGRLPDADTLASQVESVGGSQPVRVRTVKLCRRVNGYGAYDAFDPPTFVAGHEQPVIVYVELDQFRATKGTDDLYHVKLNQEVTLYSEADGLAVWRQPSVEIADDSRNRRHDFFLVQLIRLPPNLSVGKYRLNVRVTDLADSSLDEFKVPVHIVADGALVSSKIDQ